MFQELMRNFYLTFSKNYYLLLIFLVVFIPLYPKFPLLNIGGTYVAVRLEDLFIGGALLGWFAVKLPKLKMYLTDNLYRAFLLFWIIGALSLISGILITHSLEPHLGLLHWARRVEYMSLFILAATTLDSAKKVKRLVIASFATALVVVLYGFGQIWLSFPVVSTTNSEFSKGLILYLSNGARVNSTFAGHYDLAVYLSIILIMIAGQVLHLRNLAQRGLLAFIGLFGFVLLGFTAARVSFLAALIGLASVFWLSKRKLLVVGLFVAAVAIVGLIPDLRHRLVATVTVNLMGGGGPKYNPPPGTVTEFTPKQNQINPDGTPAVITSATESGAVAVDTVAGEPINTTELGVYRSFGIRFNVEWPRAINAFYKNPFLGTGYSSLTIATDNDILRSLGETGLLGTLSLTLIFFIIARGMLSSIRTSSGFERSFVTGALCSILVLLVTAVFIDVLEASKVAEFFWLILGAAWAVVMGYQGGLKQDEKP